MNNITLLLSGAVVFTSVLGIQPAQAKGKLPHKLQKCSQLQSDDKRLACYDRLAADFASKSHPVRSQPPAADTKSFGLEHKQDSEQVISATVLELSKSANGLRRFTLDNQQRWQQIGTQAFFAKEGDTVTIRRGSFNSFIMQKEGSNRSVKVRRVN
ncbi:hypothetical protein [Pseudoalteromonas rubra]|uniref:Uncharacterized protein n=1 Tax=Pseudoalteromonas rubra TaxID=43658 RepID=A0A0U2XZU6_9GAMM|nr:hypothetical protein [Pseudoalteromonas rubra]ALU43506.1 hypothetical protein AT705_11460 [Pseudoalteromonas rubra]